MAWAVQRSTTIAGWRAPPVARTTLHRQANVVDPLRLQRPLTGSGTLVSTPGSSLNGGLARSTTNRPTPRRRLLTIPSRPAVHREPRLPLLSQHQQSSSHLLVISLT